jgi:hypothetical protein
MLRPQDSSTRERKPEWLWQFRLDAEGEGRSADWFDQPLPDSRPMAVPARVKRHRSRRDGPRLLWRCLVPDRVWVPRGWQGRRIVSTSNPPRTAPQFGVNDVAANARLRTSVESMIHGYEEVAVMFASSFGSTR